MRVQQTRGILPPLLQTNSGADALTGKKKGAGMSWTLAAIYLACGLVGALLCMGARDGKRPAAVMLGAAVAAAAAFALSDLLSGTASAYANYAKWGAILVFCGGVFTLLSRHRVRRKTSGKNGKRHHLTQSQKRGIAAKSLALGLCGLCLVSGIAAFSASFGGGQAQLDDALATPHVLRSKSVNVLICGIDNDNRDGYHSQNMTDVIILANLDFEAQKATLLQIPRDTYVGDATSTGKINAVYNKKDTHEEGINALAAQLNTMFVLPIDHYVTITMEGFRKAVDAVGGIDVTLESEMVFNLRDENEVVVNTITLPAGVNTLDGTMADLFVRYRDYARADLDRMNVQRVFIAAVMAKVQQMSAVELFGALKEIYPYLSTDYSISELGDTALKGKDFATSSVTAVRIPGEPATASGQSVFSVHRDALAETLNTYMRPYTDPVAASELGAIELQNTTDLLDHSDEALSDV